MNTSSRLPGRRQQAIAIFCAALTTLIFFSPVAPAAATVPPPASETSSAPAMRFEGEAVVGRSLRFVADIDWSKRWERISYEWLVDGQFYAHAGASTIVAESHFGRRISVRMTVKEYGADPAVYLSEETPPVQGSLSAWAHHAGEPALGQTISISFSAYQITAKPALATEPERTYVWFRNGVPIPGAVSASYTVVEEDIGAEITSTVSISAPDYQTWSRTEPHGVGFRGYLSLASAPTMSWPGGPSHEVPTGPAHHVPPGTVLRASAPPVTGTAPVDLTYKYQWYASGPYITVAIPGATGATYTTAPEYVGDRIDVVVTPAAAHYKGMGWGVPTHLQPYVYGVFSGLTAPTIRGTALPGEVLTAIPATTTPSAESIVYEWYRGNIRVTSWDTNPTYEVTQADSGHRISVRARHDRARYYAATTVRSAPTPITFDTRSFMDFTGDKKSDVLVRDKTGSIWVYPGNGAGGWGTRKILSLGDQGYDSFVRPGNFNGDGDFYDYLARHDSGQLWLQSGPFGTQVGSGWSGFTIIAPGDFDGDGYSDVLARDKAGTLYLYPGNGVGGWKPRAKIGSGWQNFTTILGPGDFNGDQYVDVLARDKYGALYLYPGNGKGGWKPRAKIGSGWQNFTSISPAGDFNGDGRMDIAARDKYGALYLYPGNGSGGWKPRAKIGSGWNGFTHIF